MTLPSRIRIMHRTYSCLLSLFYSDSCHREFPNLTTTEAVQTSSLIPETAVACSKGNVGAGYSSEPLANNPHQSLLGAKGLIS